MVDLSPMTIPFKDLEEWHYSERPSLATVREIDVEVADDELSFFFSRANYSIDLTTYPGGLDGLLEKVRLGTVSLPDTVGIKPQPPVPPLSLKNRDLCYVIYKLAAKNWQFASNHAPFSIGTDHHAQNCHFEARRIDPDGNIDHVVGGHPPKDDCMVAYFISDGVAATGFAGQFVHAINIHVDLIYGGTSEARIPLIIDPDIRYPGGSG